MSRNHGCNTSPSLGEFLHRTPKSAVECVQGFLKLLFFLWITNGRQDEALSIAHDFERGFGRNSQQVHNGLIDDKGVTVSVFGQSLLHVDFSRVSTMYYHSTLCLFVRQHGKAEFFRDGISEPIGAIARVVFRVARWYEVRVSQGFVGCSVPVLSAQKPWFSQGFLHIRPIALAFLPIHACPCLQVLPL